VLSPRCHYVCGRFQKTFPAFALALVAPFQSLSQDFAKFFSRRCHVTLCGACDADGQCFRRAGASVVEQAFASREFGERNAQRDAVPCFHFYEDRTKGVAFHSDAYRRCRSSIETFHYAERASRLKEYSIGPSKRLTTSCARLNKLEQEPYSPTVITTHRV
jgi:hypothetical protein